MIRPNPYVLLRDIAESNSKKPKVDIPTTPSTSKGNPSSNDGCESFGILASASHRDENVPCSSGVGFGQKSALQIQPESMDEEEAMQVELPEKDEEADENNNDMVLPEVSDDDEDDSRDSGIKEDIEKRAKANELSYTERRQRNIEQSNEFMRNLGLDTLSEDLHKFLVSINVRRPKRPQGHKMRQKGETPSRRSLRLQHKDTEAVSQTQQVQLSLSEPFCRARMPQGPLSFEKTSLQLEKDMTSKFVKEFRFTAEEKFVQPVLKPFSWYKKEFESMSNDSLLVAKLVLSRIYCLAIHPGSDKILVAAGSTTGQIGFWDVESKADHNGIFLYEPHSERVSCLEFNPNKTCEIYSCSFDGTVRCGNLQKTVFDEVYRPIEDDIDEVLCTSFDFLSPHSFLLGNRDGSIVVVDKRTGNLRGEQTFKTHRGCLLKTVSVHPTQKNYFIAAGNNGVVSLWDMRRKTSTSVSNMPHAKTVNSAYFSPINGNYILTTCMDHKIRIFDSSSFNAMKINQVIPHNNFTGRWLTPFRAVWLPYNEEAFVVGSMSRPRCIEVIKTTGRMAHNFRSEDLNSVCSINAFHPSRSVLAGGNSSGKVYVFKQF